MTSFDAIEDSQEAAKRNLWLHFTRMSAYEQNDVPVIVRGSGAYVFDQNGKLLTVWPTELIGAAFFYVDDDDIVYIPEHNAGMISILTLDGERLARWGDMIHRSCHGIWVDSHHDLYVVQPGEWTPRARRVVKYERQ